MNLNRGKPIQRLDDRLIGQFQGILDRLALDHLRCNGACRDRGTAAKRLEFYVLDDVVLNLEVHLHNIAAARVADFADAVGIRNLADIARIGEMIEYFFGI